jgi:dTDP-glucose 4,6-dehydratase
VKRVLLTGAGGFVGHHTLEHILTTTDWEVVCLDSFRHRGKTDRIREVLDGHIDNPDWIDPEDWSQRVTVITHDLRAPISAQLNHEIGHLDYVISMASESHVDRSCVEPRPFIENNVALVLTLLEWMRGRQENYGPDSQWAVPEKFIHVSTDEVYGPAPRGHDHVEGEPHRPSNPYSASKACQEDIVYSYWRTFGLPVAISNTMNIIGERQDPEKFVPLVLSKVLKGETVMIHAGAPAIVRNGETIFITHGVPVRPGSRFYLHARNQADALKFLLETQPFPRYGETMRTTRTGPGWVTATSPPLRAEMGRWNVVGEVEIDNLNMAHLIADYAGHELRYELTDFHSSRPGHDLRYALDGSKMRDLGWEPPVPLAESLEHTVRWTLDHPNWLLP